MSRKFFVITLALAAAAVAAPFAQGVTDPNGRQVADPLAVSYLQGQGFSPGEIKVLVGQGDPLAVSYLRNHGFPQAPTQIVGTSDGFSWSDAGIGAGATLGVVLLVAGLAGGIAIARQNRRRHVASA
jgi:hypothetical protein